MSSAPIGHMTWNTVLPMVMSAQLRGITRSLSAAGSVNHYEYPENPNLGVQLAAIVNISCPIFRFSSV